MFKKEDQKRVPVEINQIILDVLALLHLEMEAIDVVVTTTLADNLPRVLGDRIQLQQVILNLVRNAVDAMNSITGRVRILRVGSGRSETGNVVVSISDSGTGIEPVNLDRIFEPFFTTKATGMGMGLSICRSIVEDHGGRLSALPGSSYGSVFEIILPELSQGAVA
jgi:C4-dicarboxylate-specific signal transduction histidine kinase